jgi:N-ethylmaleimide reductase
VDQFLRDGSNQREDNYGGSAENRCRFLLEVTDAVVSEWGANRVGIRLSPLSAFNSMFDSRPESLFRHAVQELARRQLAYLHVVSQNDFANSPQSFDLASLQKLWPTAFMLNGGYTRETAEETLTSGAADFVSFGQLYLANPDLTDRFARNAPLNEANPSTFYGGGAEGYTDYPALDGGS